MSESTLLLRRLVEHVLGQAQGGRELPLAMLLEQLAPVGELRRLARKFGLSPKGFRVDRAPARVLAKELADLQDGQLLDEVLGLLKPAPPASPRARPRDGEADGQRAETEALLRLREAELTRVRDELER
ncbi:MAG: hypothetical protein KDE27_31325, partial [Planctomycetes bacterium]|nr:hypothetical protein [Planctomycetota bacterium]